MRLNADQGSDNATLTLIDTFGRIVHRDQTTGTTHDLDLRNQPKGLYLLTLCSEQGIATQRLILE